MKKLPNQIHQWGNLMSLVIICITLLFAFYIQLLHHELPCPLCLLQRLCFIAIGVGVCMNLTQGIKVTHYGLMILAALLGLTIALRQVFLHVAPGDLGYGSPLLGLYLYTWSAIGFVLIIGLIALALLCENGFHDSETSKLSARIKLIMVFFLILILANGVSTFLECGLFICKDNPVHYYFLDTIA